ncbi:DUF881 domain-containing protein [Tissierella creatinophila]|uniref:DUF881 domain-containing protein n=1 Tax=Tissierella creatinophila DSM 6911 TaxID=1123403 RepID=A0A1U7M9B4_TISCR|nr:DUF881 domain-containing protein [Tissierella creatinophila]OLS03887.1 hypothetical protein TICRE_00140 [Tissierella creatinophila DSM 6911]
MQIDKGKFLILVSSIGLGILISTMMKSNLESYVPVTLLSLEVMQEDLKFINSEVNELKDEFKEKEEELKSIKGLSYSDSTIVDKLNIDLVSSKSISGHMALEGPGIIIKMYDNPEDEIIGQDVNDDVIHDVDVLNILNDLRVAGAEAISINGERVVSSSELKCRGPVIGINGISIGTPFIIRAIGDQKLLMAAVNAPGTYGDALKNIFAIGFEPEVEDDLFIPAYSGNFSFKYAKPKGEGDK